MNDWTGAAVIDGFPKENMTYYIQFVTEPTIVTKKSDYGGKYKQAQIAVQFFSIDDTGNYHYIDWENLTVQPCVLADLTCFGPGIISRLIKVKGVRHKKHVDLELLDSWDYIDPNALITKDNPPDSKWEGSSGPSKPAADRLACASGNTSVSSERGQPGAGVVGPNPTADAPRSTGDATPADPCPYCQHAKRYGDTICKACGERVG